jgi:hypothetical protein
MEAKSATALASVVGETEGFARRIALLEDELTEACQAQDTPKANSQGLFEHGSRCRPAVRGSREGVPVMGLGAYPSLNPGF